MDGFLYMDRPELCCYGKSMGSMGSMGSRSVFAHILRHDGSVFLLDNTLQIKEVWSARVQMMKAPHGVAIWMMKGSVWH